MKKTNIEKSADVEYHSEKDEREIRVDFGKVAALGDRVVNKDIEGEPLSAGEFSKIYDEFRKVVSDDPASNNIPVPPQHFQSIVGKDPRELASSASEAYINYLVATDPSCIKRLMNAPLDGKCKAKQEFIVNLLSAPVVMNRNRGFDKRKDIGTNEVGEERETIPMVELNSALFEYCRAFPETTREEIAIFFEIATNGTPESVKGQVPGTLRGVGCEVAFSRIGSLKERYVHASVVDDLHGKDFVNPSNADDYLDLKLKERLPDGTTVEKLFYDSATHRLYIPPGYLGNRGPYMFAPRYEQILSSFVENSVSNH